MRLFFKVAGYLGEGDRKGAEQRCKHSSGEPRDATTNGAQTDRTVAGQNCSICPLIHPSTNATLSFFKQQLDFVARHVSEVIDISLARVAKAHLSAAVHLLP